MKPILIPASLALAFAIALPVAAGPLRLDSRNQPVVAIHHQPDGGFAVSVSEQALKTAGGRARLAAALDSAAATSCASVRPLRAAQDCASQMIATATRDAGPETERALRMARQDALAVVAANSRR